MSWVALSCPQCSAPLPRVAIWRSVKCESCGALITKTESVVQRDSFRQALARARQGVGGAGGAGGAIDCGGARYRLLQRLGSGEMSEVHLGCRVGALPLLATIKLSSASGASDRLAREAAVLRELGAAAGDSAGGGACDLLPEVVACGPADGGGGPARHALVLRHANGFWGSLADLNARFPAGIDPRHAVWIWRRMLGVLECVHALGWCHGDVRPEHALVHPGDHGVRLIGWASATKDAGAEARAADLMRCAMVVLVLVRGNIGAGGAGDRVPAGLAELIERASRDAGFCQQQGARGLDALLRAAAQSAYGPPSFVPLEV